MTDDRPSGNPESPDAASIIDSQLDGLRSRFSDRLSADEWAGVRKAIAEQRDHAAKLRAVPLLNADEPATIFHVESGDD